MRVFQATEKIPRSIAVGDLVVLEAIVAWAILEDRVRVVRNHRSQTPAMIVVSVVVDAAGDREL